jgi:phosphoglycolate phosphatase-like HAD superfamily hydrolase
MAFKSLVLDIDGVLIRDRRLLAHVKHNCVRYVAKKLPDCKDPAYTNKILYATAGHTARGLQNSFGIDTSDFNKEVYDVPLRSRLCDVLSSTQFQGEAKQLRELTHNGWKLTLFTNAPIEWAGDVANAISDEVYVVCPGSNVVESPLKPEGRAYRDFAKHHTHVFVDDSLTNLMTSRWLPNWHPIHFNPGLDASVDWCPTVGSIWEVCLFANSVVNQMDNHETF